MTVFPEPGEVAEVAKLLLQLADSPYDVATTLDPGVGFTVPFWLYKSFTEVWDVRNDVVSEAPQDVPAESVPEAPARKKPGRPRKED